MSPISEDEVRARLRSVDATPVHRGYAEQLLHQGQARRRRRRVAAVVAAAAAVAVIGVGALALGDQLGREAALPARPTPTPTSQEPTPTATAPRSPSTSPSPTATATSTARPSASVGPTPSASSAPARTATPTPALAPVTFLHAGVKGDGESTSDWTSATTFAGPCSRDAWVLAGGMGVAERRAISGGGGDGGASAEALFVFRSADSAVAFMGELRRLSRACESATDGGTRGIVESLPGPWGEGLALTTFALDSDGTTGGGPVVLAVRAGRSVALSNSAGPFRETDEVNPGLVRSARPGIEHLFPQLCRYTEAGC